MSVAQCIKIKTEENTISPENTKNENCTIKTASTTETISDDEEEPINDEKTNEYLNNIAINIKWSELQNLKKLIENRNTIIYTAYYQGNTVIVKTINPKNEKNVDTVIKDLEDELIMLSKLNHDNIVKLHGAGYKDGYRFVIMEYCDRGTLVNFLGKKCKECQPDRDEFCFEIGDALKYARCIADAMLYLHDGAVEGSMVLHRDLKPDNIGLTKDGKIKLLDFGLAKIVQNKSNDTYKMTGMTGTLLYMSPEVATLQPYNYKTDVYSFGILLWQLLTCQEPYCCIETKLLYRSIVMKFARPPLKHTWPKELILLMQKCWHPDYEVRPAFREVVEELDCIIDTLDRRKDVGLSWSTIVSFLIPFLALCFSFYYGSFLWNGD